MHLRMPSIDKGVQAFLWAQAPAPETVIHRVDRARLIRDVTTLTSPAFEGRRIGTPGALKVRRWLMDEFREAGLTPGGTDGFLQPFTLTSRDSDPSPASGSSAQVGGAAANVIGLVPGRERQRKLLVITAHHDHLGIRDGVLYPDDDGFATTAPVGSFPLGASRWGIDDLAGNVWEWVADGYGPYTADDAVDPKGAYNAPRRVVRGGAWNGAQSDWIRPSFRYSFPPDTRSHGVGFRCVK